MPRRWHSGSFHKRSDHRRKVNMEPRTLNIELPMGESFRCSTFDVGCSAFLPIAVRPAVKHETLEIQATLFRSTDHRGPPGDDGKGVSGGRKAGLSPGNDLCPRPRFA